MMGATRLPGTGIQFVFFALLTLPPLGEQPTSRGTSKKWTPVAVPVNSPRLRSMRTEMPMSPTLSTMTVIFLVCSSGITPRNDGLRWQSRTEPAFATWFSIPSNSRTFRMPTLARQAERNFTMLTGMGRSGTTT